MTQDPEVLIGAILHDPSLLAMRPAVGASCAILPDGLLRRLWLKTHTHLKAHGLVDPIVLTILMGDDEEFTMAGGIRYLNDLIAIYQDAGWNPYEPPEGVAA